MFSAAKTRMMKRVVIIFAGVMDLVRNAFVVFRQLNESAKKGVPIKVDIFSCARLVGRIRNVHFFNGKTVMIAGQCSELVIERLGALSVIFLLIGRSRLRATIHCLCMLV